MNVASLELSRELYELSEWSMDIVSDVLVGDTTYGGHFDSDGNFVAPKYELGYLLRRLPTNVMITCTSLLRDEWICGAGESLSEVEDNAQEADTPEDAAAKLAIELFKQGVLTRDES